MGGTGVGKVDSAMRVAKQRDWNRPVYWPIVLAAAVLIAVLLAGARSLRRRERMNARGEVLTA